MVSLIPRIDLLKCIQRYWCRLCKGEGLREGCWIQVPVVDSRFAVGEGNRKLEVEKEEICRQLTGSEAKLRSSLLSKLRIPISGPTGHHHRHHKRPLPLPTRQARLNLLQPSPNQTTCQHSYTLSSTYFFASYLGGQTTQTSSHTTALTRPSIHT